MIPIPRQLDSKLRRKIVKILRNYVKISALRGVRLTFRSPFSGRGMKAGLNPSGITVQAPPVRARDSRSRI